MRAATVIAAWLLGALGSADLGHASEIEALANGVFLVAKPELEDPNFRQTVVLITQPEPGGGPIGVVINRSSERRLREVFPDNAQLAASDERIFYGGPVRRSVLLFVFRASTAPAASLHVLDDIYLSGNGTLLEELLARPEPTRDLRVYAGYSGWAPGQLQAEIARGGWVVVKAQVSLIFSQDPASVWGELINRAALRRTEAPIPALPVAQLAR